MRDIKFRARNANLPRCWIYGYFVIEKGHCYIINEDGRFPVIAGTEEQLTGIKDKNGRAIYEGDILKHIYLFQRELKERIVVVRYDLTQCAFIPFGFHIYACKSEHIEVIGNIYENPELIKD